MVVGSEVWRSNYFGFNRRKGAVYYRIGSTTMGTLPYRASVNLFSGRQIEHAGPFLGAISGPEVDHDNEERGIDFPI